MLLPAVVPEFVFTAELYDDPPDLMPLPESMPMMAMASDSDSFPREAGDGWDGGVSAHTRPPTPPSPAMRGKGSEKSGRGVGVGSAFTSVAICAASSRMLG